MIQLGFAVCDACGLVYAVDDDDIRQHEYAPMPNDPDDGNDTSAVGECVQGGACRGTVRFIGYLSYALWRTL